MTRFWYNFKHMKNPGLRNALWRSRAVAIIGFLVMLLAIFNGLPSTLKTTLFVVLGLLIFAFGFAGSRHKSYSDDSDHVFDDNSEDVLDTEQIFPVVETESQIKTPANIENN